MRSAFEQEQLDEPLLYTLKWRQGQLLVSLEQPRRKILPSLPPLETEEWLVKCLKHSYVKLIRIDAALGEVSLKLWAQACEKANKPVFLRLPPTIKLPKQRSLARRFLQLLDSIIATLLLLVLSPVILVLFCLLSMQSSEPVLYGQWHVGERGKLFRLFKFRTTVVNHTYTLENQLISEPINILKPLTNSKTTKLGYWMRKFKLDQLPQLFNVLRGEIKLIKPRPLSLEQALFSLEERQRNNTLL